MVPVTVLAADQTLRAFDLGSWRWWATAGFVVFVSFAGWAASSLAQLARWTEGWPARFEILQRMITSLMAGVIAYALAQWGGVADIPAMVLTAVAGWGGEKFIGPMLDRAVEMASVLFGKGVNKT